jgi:hypothetical protein
MQKFPGVLNQSASIIMAALLVISGPLTCDYFLGTDISVWCVIWLNIGVSVMRARKIAYPLPQLVRIDVGGGLRFLWWAAFWPSYLRV